MAEALQRHLEFAVFMVTDHLEQLIPRQHEFTDGRHQRFEQFDIHPDRLIGD